jgi:hypothetical protein
LVTADNTCFEIKGCEEGDGEKKCKTCRDGYRP